MDSTPIFGGFILSEQLRKKLLELREALNDQTAPADMANAYGLTILNGILGENSATENEQRNYDLDTAVKIAEDRRRGFGDY